MPPELKQIHAAGPTSTKNKGFTFDTALIALPNEWEHPKACLALLGLSYSHLASFSV